jgi:hypothetical protein
VAVSPRFRNVLTAFAVAVVALTVATYFHAFESFEA